jgi:hypothetical protein
MALSISRMDDISTLEMTNPIDSGRKEIALETGRVEPQLPTVPLWRLVTLGIRYTKKMSDDEESS